MKDDIEKQHWAWVATNPLRAWRAEREVSQYTAATLLGVTPVTIQAWERGSVYPRPPALARVGELLGRPLEAEWGRWYADCPNKVKVA
jgi:transcriptional regulator with XRE-family HTH domain